MAKKAPVIQHNRVGVEPSLQTQKVVWSLDGETRAAVARLFVGREVVIEESPIRDRDRTTMRYGKITGVATLMQGTYSYVLLFQPERLTLNDNDASGHQEAYSLTTVRSIRTVD